MTRQISPSPRRIAETREVRVETRDVCDARPRRAHWFRRLKGAKSGCYAAARCQTVLCCNRRHPRIIVANVRARDARTNRALTFPGGNSACERVPVAAGELSSARGNGGGGDHGNSSRSAGFEGSPANSVSPSPPSSEPWIKAGGWRDH